MKISGTVANAIAVGVCALFAVAPVQAAETIKVGILHSLSGTMAISETSLKDVALMTIGEINAKGGLLGKKIEPIVVDPASNWPRARLGIGYVPQGREIFPRLSVSENLSVGEAAAGDRQEVEPQRELEALFPGLRAMRSRPGGNLSGGQQQQLAIARALIARPKLLLLGEPTEGIQPSIIKEIQRVLRVLLERGITILLVEQYLEFALSLAQHYAILSRGSVVDRGRIEDLRPDEVRRYLAL